jgi:hypothetical protein
MQPLSLNVSFFDQTAPARPVKLSNDLGLKIKILAKEEQSWTNRPVSTSVNCAANRSSLKLNCASTKRLAKAAQDRRALNIRTSPADPLPRQEVAHIATACQAFRPGCRQPRKSVPGELQMSLETILIIVLVVFLLGGGGWYWRGRG